MKERLCLICTESRRQNNLEPEIETEIHSLYFVINSQYMRGKWFFIIKKTDNFDLQTYRGDDVVLQSSDSCYIVQSCDSCTVAA